MISFMKKTTIKFIAVNYNGHREITNIPQDNHKMKHVVRFSFCGLSIFKFNNISKHHRTQLYTHTSFADHKQPSNRFLIEYSYIVQITSVV